MRRSRELGIITKFAHEQLKQVVVEEPQDKAEREACEESFYEFIKSAWHTIEGDEPFVTGWHILAMCLHLELTIAGKINFLIINVPPGYCKSIVAIMFNAWIWLQDPKLKFMHLSYSHKLSSQHNDLFRRIITSKWYQKHWGNRFKIVKDNESEVTLSTPGKRISTSVESRFVTGMHFNYIVLDDPNSAADVHTKSVTDRVNHWYDNVLQSRLLPGGIRIVIQQRFNDWDLTGHILGKKLAAVVLLKLAEQYDPEHACTTVEIDGKLWKDPRTKPGEILWPEFKPREIVAQNERENSKRIYAGQFQQEPMPLDGEIFERKHFKIYENNFTPDFKYLVQSWDTALKVGDTNCYSACSTWGIYEDQYNIPNNMLVSTFRAKVTNAQLYDVARNMAYDYLNDALGSPFRVEIMRKPNLVLVEDKVNGVGLIEDLARSGINVQPFTPKGCKEYRAIRASVLLENGKVWLLAKPGGELYKFSQEFLEMAISWPNNKDGTDLIDTMSQALLFIMEHSEVMPNTFIAHRKFLEARPPSFD